MMQKPCRMLKKSAIKAPGIDAIITCANFIDKICLKFSLLNGIAWLFCIVNEYWFLGLGHITSSVIEGIFKSKLKIKKIYISPRNRLISKKLARKFKKIAISKNNQQLIDK